VTATNQAMFADATAYQQFMGRYADKLALEFVAAAETAPGQRILDVGCGTGALTAILADVAGAESVAGVDPSPPFVEEARRRVPGADLRVGPAESLPFEDDSFDRALSQLVFHFVSDPRAAADEMARVTRPGGKVASCVWDMTGGMTMLRAYWDAAADADVPREDEVERWGGRPGQLAALWHEAGLTDVADTTLTVSSQYESFDELWGSMSRSVGPVGAHASGLRDEQRDAVREALRRRVGSPDGTFSLTASAFCVVGTA